MMKKTLKILGGIVAAFFAIVIIILVIDLSNEDSATTSTGIVVELEEYKIVNQEVKDGTAIIEIKNEGTISKVDFWLSNFSQNAVAVLEESFKDDKVNKVRIYENSTFTDGNGKENENILFDLTITKEVANQLEYDNFKSMTYTQPYQLFNKAESYTIHVGMFKNELSPEIQKGFTNSFEKKAQ